MTDYNQKKFMLDAARYLLAQKRDPIVAENLFASKGLCSGISALWLYCTFMSHQPVTEKKRDDLQWYYETRDLLANWDGSSEFTPEQIEEIDHMLDMIILFQESYIIGKMQSDLTSLLLDSKGRKFSQEYQLTGAYTLPQLESVLAKIIKPHKINDVSVPHHGVAIYFDGDQYHYMDPNKPYKHFSTSSIEELAKEIFSCFEYQPDEVVPISFSISGIEDDQALYPTHAEILSEIPAENFTAKIKKPMEMTALHMAAGKGDVESIKYMLSTASVDPTVTLGKDQVLAVELSALSGKKSCMALFQQHYTTRMVAIAAIGDHDRKTIEYLLESGINLNESFHKSENLELARADQSIVTSYHEAGGDFKAIDDEGRSALFSAASRGDLGRAKLLIEYGACPMTALHYCVRNQRLDAFSLLVTAAQETQVRVDWDELAKTAVESQVNVPKADFASIVLYREAVTEINSTLVKVKHGRCRHFIQLMLENINDIDELKYDGSALLHLAAEQNRFTNVKTILSQGANPNRLTSTGESAYSILMRQRGRIKVDALNSMMHQYQFDFCAELVRAYENENLVVMRAALSAITDVMHPVVQDLVICAVVEKTPAAKLLLQQYDRNTLVNMVCASGNLQAQCELVKLRLLSPEKIIMLYADTEQLELVLSELKTVLNPMQIHKVILQAFDSRYDTLALFLIEYYQRHHEYTPQLLRLMDVGSAKLLDAQYRFMQQSQLLMMSKHVMAISNLEQLGKLFSYLDIPNQVVLFNQAITEQNLAAVRVLLESGFELNRHINEKSRLMGLVVRCDDLAMFKQLEATVQWDKATYQKISERARAHGSGNIARYCLDKKVQDYIQQRQHEGQHAPSIFALNPLPGCKNWLRHSMFNRGGRIMYTEQQKLAAAQKFSRKLSVEDLKELELSDQERAVLKNGRLGEIYSEYEALVPALKVR